MSGLAVGGCSRTREAAADNELAGDTQDPERAPGHAKLAVVGVCVTTSIISSPST
jgi:hypothetical protein